jgi:hypothetical protein
VIRQQHRLQAIFEQPHPPQAPGQQRCAFGFSEPIEPAGGFFQRHQSGHVAGVRQAILAAGTPVCGAIEQMPGSIHGLASSPTRREGAILPPYPE